MSSLAYSPPTGIEYFKRANESWDEFRARYANVYESAEYKESLERRKRIDAKLAAANKNKSASEENDDGKLVPTIANFAKYKKIIYSEVNEPIKPSIFDYLDNMPELYQKNIFRMYKLTHKSSDIKKPDDFANFYEKIRDVCLKEKPVAPKQPTMPEVPSYCTHPESIANWRSANEYYFANASIAYTEKLNKYNMDMAFYEANTQVIEWINSYIETLKPFIHGTRYCAMPESSLKEQAKMISEQCILLVNDADPNNPRKIKEQKYYAENIMCITLKSVKMRFKMQQIAIDDYDVHFIYDTITNSDTKESILLRLQCEQFWKRRLRKFAKMARQEWTAALRLAGGPSPYAPAYCCDYSLQTHIERQELGEKFLKDRLVVYDYTDENGDTKEATISLHEVVEKSKEVALARLFGITKGIENSIDESYVSVMATFSLPPPWHPNPSKGNNSWAPEFTPDAADKRLQYLWAHFRGIIFSRNIKLFGLRVKESHLDGCPHLHFGFFVRWQDVSMIDEIMKKVFPEWNNNETITPDKQIEAKERIDRAISKKDAAIARMNTTTAPSKKRKALKAIEYYDNIIERAETEIEENPSYTRYELEQAYALNQPVKHARVSLDVPRKFTCKRQLIRAYKNKDKSRVASNIIIIDTSKKRDPATNEMVSVGCQMSTYLFKYLFKSLNVNPSQAIKDRELGVAAAQLDKKIVANSDMIDDDRMDEVIIDDHESGDQISNFERHRAAASEKRCRRYEIIGVHGVQRIIQAIYRISENDLDKPEFRIPQVVKNIWHDLHDNNFANALKILKAIPALIDSDGQPRIRTIYEDYVNMYNEPAKRPVGYGLKNGEISEIHSCDFSKVLQDDYYGEPEYSQPTAYLWTMPLKLRPSKVMKKSDYEKEKNQKIADSKPNFGNESIEVATSYSCCNLSKFSDRKIYETDNSDFDDHPTTEQIDEFFDELSINFDFSHATNPEQSKINFMRDYSEHRKRDKRPRDEFGNVDMEKWCEMCRVENERNSANVYMGPTFEQINEMKARLRAAQQRA